MEYFYINNLPLELVVYVFSFADPIDLAHLARTCQLFHQLITPGNGLIWRTQAIRLFPELKSLDLECEAPANFNWKNYIEERFNLTSPDLYSWIWHPITSNFPSPRIGHTAVSLGDGRIAFCGGYHPDIHENKLRLNDVIFFDTKNVKFSPQNVKNAPNFARHACVRIGDAIYTFGGFDGISQFFGLGKLDLNTCEWVWLKTSGDIPLNRTNHSMAAIGETIYLHGGNRTNEKNLYEVFKDYYCLDTKTLVWTNLSSKIHGDQLEEITGHRLHAFHNKVFKIGGGVWSREQGWEHKYGGISELDTTTLKLKNLPSPALTVSTFPQTFILKNWLFIFGGGSIYSGGISNHFFLLDTISKQMWPLHETEDYNGRMRDIGTFTFCEGSRSAWVFAGGMGDAINYLDELKHPFFEKMHLDK